jgi:hypothetical protein
MDFLGVFSFRTAFPFGYLITLAALVGAAALGLALLLLGLGAHPFDRTRVVCGGGLVAMVVFSVAANQLYGAALELNPLVTAANVIGEWREDRARLSLHPDGTYHCDGFGECNAFGADGRWWLADSGELTFDRIDGRRTSQRVVRYFGALRLTDPIYDPDSWDGQLTFARVDPPDR